MLPRYRRGSCCFNPRAHRARDLCKAWGFRLVNMFQSTRPRRARPYDLHRRGSPQRFNPRAHRGARPRRSALSILATVFQSTRPRGARLVAGRTRHDRLVVSIHSPAGGATTGRPLPRPSRASFNPRARGGRDRPRGLDVLASRCFNPRARGGRDLSMLSTIRPMTGFNPRARGGRDVALVALRSPRKSFNPRARRGRDGDTLQFGRTSLVSIHAPAGARRVFAGTNHQLSGFQSTRHQRWLDRNPCVGR